MGIGSGDPRFHGGQPQNRTPRLVHQDRKRRFELLALPHLDAAFNLARWLAGNTADAEDVVQEAYLRAFRYFDAYQGGNFRVWLLTIVRNSFFTWAKENRSNRLVFHAETPTGDTAETETTAWGTSPRDPEALLMERLDSQTLTRLMERLSPDTGRCCCCARWRTSPTRKSQSERRPDRHGDVAPGAGPAGAAQIVVRRSGKRRRAMQCDRARRLFRN